MAKVKATKEGYYEHRIVKVGEVFDMKEVDKDGFYVDAKGAKLLFGEDGKIAAEGVKGKQRKCGWVAARNTPDPKPIDPKAVAAAVSGKNPGQPAHSAESAAESAE